MVSYNCIDSQYLAMAIPTSSFIVHIMLWISVFSQIFYHFAFTWSMMVSAVPTWNIGTFLTWTQCIPEMLNDNLLLLPNPRSVFSFKYECFSEVLNPKYTYEDDIVWVFNFCLLYNYLRSYLHLQQKNGSQNCPCWGPVPEIYLMKMT